ncbi:MAG: hypothetical protein ACRDC4_07250 [Plesiomonas sp.]
MIKYKHIEYNTLYAVAPQGSIICKAIGRTKWLPSKMSFSEFNKAINLGYMVKIERG